MIKLIATDMDGTLLNDDHATVSQRNVDALQRAAEQGIEVVISSGRPWSLLQDIADRVAWCATWWRPTARLCWTGRQGSGCFR